MLRSMSVMLRARSRQGVLQPRHGLVGFHLARARYSMPPRWIGSIYNQLGHARYRPCRQPAGSKHMMAKAAGVGYRGVGHTIGCRGKIMMF